MGTTLEGTVTLDSGIQLCTVPNTGSYVIDAVGASGSNGSCTELSCSGWSLEGLGARVAGTFDPVNGETLKILIGQEGRDRKVIFPKMPGVGVAARLLHGPISHL